MMVESSTTLVSSAKQKCVGEGIQNVHNLTNMHSDRLPNGFVLNLEFSKRIRVLEKKGLQIQYQLACLSTLGGAHHLCNHPETAFIIACRQEVIGRLLGSLSVVIRAKVFQAVNLSLLGRQKASKQLFKACKRVAAENSWTGMAAFVEASQLWLDGQRKLTGEAASACNNASMHMIDDVCNESADSEQRACGSPPAVMMQLAL